MEAPLKSSKTGEAESRYNNLNHGRSAVLERARAASELTLPSVMPPDGSTEETSLDTPFQGLGAQGVSHLAAKILQAILPVQTAFFNLQVDEAVLNEIEKQEPAARKEIEKRMLASEKTILQDIESQGLRIPAFALIKNLIITGNALLHAPDEGSFRSFRLDQFVVLRDGDGNILEIVVKEMINPDALPEEVKEQIKGNGQNFDQDPKTNKKKDIPVFTWIVRDGGLIKEHQEVLGIVIDGSDGSHPIDKSPWITLRWSALPGEHYGRGLVEELFGDLKSLEGFYRALVKGTAAAAKTVFMVNPAGVTRPEHLARASTGDIIRGREEDVSVLRADKAQDFSTAQAMIDIIEKRLKGSFLMTSSVTRNAERVTAEEIRLLAAELESGLGGVFSLMSQEFQTPLLGRLMERAKIAGKLPAMPKDTVLPKIVTGMDALGRGQNLDKLRVYAETLQLVPGSDQGTNPIEFNMRVAHSLGIDTDGLVKSPEDIQAEQQQAQMAQAAQAAAPGVATEVTKGMMNQQQAVPPQ
jgi:hypothetical protein